MRNMILRWVVTSVLRTHMAQLPNTIGGLNLLNKPAHTRVRVKRFSELNPQHLPRRRAIIYLYQKGVGGPYVWIRVRITEDLYGNTGIVIFDDRLIEIAH